MKRSFCSALGYLTKFSEGNLPAFYQTQYILLQIQEVIQLLEDSQGSSESEQLKEKLSVILQWRIMAIVG